MDILPKKDLTEPQTMVSNIMELKPCIKFKAESQDITDQIGRRFGSVIIDTLCSGKTAFKKIAIALYGDLGAGKTTFVQGFARGLGVPESYYITSPTYNIINQYPIEISKELSKNNNAISGRLDDKLTLYHIDLYRIGSPDELEYLGFDDIASSESSVIIVEWPDIAKSCKNIIEFDLEIRIEIDQNFNREISFIPYGLDAINLLKHFV